MTVHPKIGVIILAYNSEKHIMRAIESVARQTYDTITMYIVDNASTDATRSILARQENSVVILNDKNYGYAGGNNIGIRRAIADGCDAVFILNDDAYLESTAISELVSCAKDERVGAIQPLIVLHQDKSIINSSGNKLQYLGFSYAGGYRERADTKELATASIPVASGAAVLLFKRALDDIGLFDETFFLYHEDVDLSWRMRLRGWNVMFCKTAIAYHEYSFQKSIQKYYYMERNRMMFLLKNFSAKYLLIIFPMFFITEVGLCFFAIKNGFFGERIHAWRYFISITNLRLALRSRREIQQKRTVRDAELLTYLSTDISSQEVDSALLRYFGNPLFSMYFKIVRRML